MPYKLEPLERPAQSSNIAVQGSKVQTSYIPEVFEEKKTYIIFFPK